MKKPAPPNPPPVKDFPGLAQLAELCKVETSHLLEVLWQGPQDGEDLDLIERYRNYANLATNPAPLLAQIRKFPASEPQSTNNKNRS